MVSHAPIPYRASQEAIAEIPIETVRNKTIVPVTVGDRKLRLILDTGYASDGILIFDRRKIDSDTLGPFSCRHCPGSWFRNRVERPRVRAGEI